MTKMRILELLLSFLYYFHPTVSCLYPRESETREIKSLDGLWKFKISPLDDQERGFKEMWYKNNFLMLGDYLDMPVPSSYNDITANSTIRDFIGWVWYQRDFYLPPSWKKKRVSLHFGSVHYNSIIWIGGKEVGRHEGGHIAFEMEIPGEILHFDQPNLLVVACNSTLTNHTIPQGFLSHPNNSLRYPPGYTVYHHDFDYFDYAGINREVLLYATPLNYISCLEITTTFKNGIGYVDYSVLTGPALKEKKKCNVTLLNREGYPVAKCNSCSSKLKFYDVQLWWPGKSYLYTLLVIYNYEDTYRLPVGIRTVEFNETHLFVNKKPVYLKGFGMHEDSNVRGRGFDLVMLARDFSLIQWTGANAIRTSHYPYSFQFLDMADKTGLMVILESPACSLSNFDSEMQARHVQVMEEIISRYRLHPSIIMWSLANEPLSNLNEADHYFSVLVNSVKYLDPTRPVTFVTSQQIASEKAIQYMDIICLNRYSGWYQDPGKTELITYQVKEELMAWHKKYKKPVILTEYGAGSISSHKSLPGTMWSESYQAVTLVKHFEAFDSLRNYPNTFLAGEMIWNMIDFNTPQEYIRPGLCVKGIFTREREPKMAAYLVKERFANLATCRQEHGNCSSTLTAPKQSCLIL